MKNSLKHHISLKTTPASPPNLPTNLHCPHFSTLPRFHIYDTDFPTAAKLPADVDVATKLDIAPTVDFSSDDYAAVSASVDFAGSASIDFIEDMDPFYAAGDRSRTTWKIQVSANRGGKGYE
jgi:hypothetical protein